MIPGESTTTMITPTAADEEETAAAEQQAARISEKLEVLETLGVVEKDLESEAAASASAPGAVAVPAGLVPRDQLKPKTKSDKPCFHQDPSKSKLKKYTTTTTNVTKDTAKCSASHKKYLEYLDEAASSNYLVSTTSNNGNAASTPALENHMSAVEPGAYRHGQDAWAPVEAEPESPESTTNAPPALEATTSNTNAASSTAAPPNNPDGLVEAQPVDGASRFLNAAEELDPEDLEQQAARRSSTAKENCRRDGGILVSVLIVLLAVGLGVGLGTTASSRRGGGCSEEDAKEEMAANSTTSSSKIPPLLDVLYNDLPEDTKTRLMIPSPATNSTTTTTPQRRAWDWLLEHPDLPNLPEWRKKQLFAMTSFFHSFEGPHWPIPIRSNWMNYEVNECSWLTPYPAPYQAVQFNFKRETLYEQEFCNSEGRIQTMTFFGLVLPPDQGFHPSVPPELALLTGLEAFTVILSEVSAKLEDVLPPPLPKLKYLSYFDSRNLHGTIPASIGRLTSLASLFIARNQLTGTIPTQVGELTYLDQFFPAFNSLTGPVPSQLGRLTKLTDLVMSFNELSGDLPTQLGLLTNMVDVAIHEEGIGNRNVSGMLPAAWCHLADPNCTAAGFTGPFSTRQCALRVDCSEILCGCHCPCNNTSNSTGTATRI